MTILSISAVFCLFAALPYAFSKRQHIFTLAILTSSFTALVGVFIGLRGLFQTEPFAAGGVFLDPLACAMLAVILFIQWTATLASVPYLKNELDRGVITIEQMKRYFALLNLFVLSLIVVASAESLGIMWIALEATTLATTLLIAFYAWHGSLEAAWKYLIICSTGIALGLIGIILTFHAASLAGLAESAIALDWRALVAIAPTLSPDLMKIAFVFILIGFGTKAGLVPMHTWLPDAHSKAPAPISGLLSGVLLSTALVAILRYKTLTDLALGDATWTGNLLVFFGALTVAVPVAFILGQHDYKRLLAYSSIEHMGLALFAFGLGGFGTLVGVVHLIGHALAKSLSFFATGAIVTRFESSKFDRVSGVSDRLPMTAGLFLAGILALLAVPPSPLFFSEIGLMSVAFGSHPILAAIVLLSLSLIAAEFIRLIGPFLFARDMQKEKAVEQLTLAHVGMALHVIALVVLAAMVVTPWGVSILERIVASIVLV